LIAYVFRRVLPSLLLTVTVLGACESPAIPSLQEPVRAEIYRLGTEERLASMHGDFWYGRIELDEGEDLALEVRFLDASNSVVPVGGGSSLRVGIVPGQPIGPISMVWSEAQLRLIGAGRGETRLLLEFLQNDRVIWSAPSLTVLVRERGLPVTAEVFRRGTSQRLAYVHGDHWHGQISVPVGGSIEVDVRFLDSANRPIALGGENEVRASIRAGSPGDVVTVLGRGDHLELEGRRAGSTQALIHFVNDGRITWSTPPVGVAVQ
jgi:hypothetical protein